MRALAGSLMAAATAVLLLAVGLSIGGCPPSSSVDGLLGLISGSDNPGGTMPTLPALEEGLVGGQDGSDGEPAALEVQLNPTAWRVNSGQTVTIQAAVSGGSPPFEYWWFISGDANYDLGGESVARMFGRPPSQTVYLILRDANGVESPAYTIDIVVDGDPVDEPVDTSQPEPNEPSLGVPCPSVAGVWHYTWGTQNSEYAYTFELNDDGTVTHRVEGRDQCDERFVTQFTGTLNGRVLTGTLERTYPDRRPVVVDPGVPGEIPDCSPGRAIGYEVVYEFTEDWSHFIGTKKLIWEDEPGNPPSAEYGVPVDEQGAHMSCE